MESQCEYFMYFPAVPFAARELLRTEPGRYRALPRRNHLYLGETVRFLLVLRCRTGSGSGSEWSELASSLSALASVSPGGNGEAEQDGGGQREGDKGAFRECEAVINHGNGGERAAAGVPVEDPIVCTDEVIFPLTIALDKLPPSTCKAKIVVTVWQRDAEPAELQEGGGRGGYLGLLQGRAPTHVFKQEQGAFKAQVSTLLTVLPPPVVRCRQLTVCGKYLTVLKVQNSSSHEEISLRDVRVLPNFNASYLPVMPDGSVLLVDDVCHHSGEVPVGSFCPVSGSSPPCALSALEEHNFLFQLQAPERPPQDTKEGLEVPLVAVIQWSTPKLPFTSSIYTHYRLPSIRLERPRFVLSAACDSPVRARQRFTVTYTLLNQLHDFIAVRLVWTPDCGTVKALSGEERRAAQAALDAIVCHSPSTHLGSSRKGSASTIRVAFQALRAGLFELSQHMKLKLQFTAGATPEARPPPTPQRRSSPGSAVRDLVDRHQGLGRSQSFSHQQPNRGHLSRSGSALERRAITPPVGSPVGRPLYAPPERTALSLDKIAKRECKVLVVAPVQ